MNSWLKAKLGRARVSTLVLVVAFLALFWVYYNFEPRPVTTEVPTPAVVPPGFVPDPNYTWVPRTNVVRPKETETSTTTPTTTSPTETTSPDETPTSPGETPTSPGETSSPTSPTGLMPSTTVIDPDGRGPLPPLTVPVLVPPSVPGLGSASTPTTTSPPG